MTVLKINILSETTVIKHVSGPHFAFKDCVDLLREQPDIEVHINSTKSCHILHAHTYGPYFFYKGLSYKGRRIISAHIVPNSSIDNVMCAKTFYPLWSKYLRAVYNFADVTIALSPSSKEELENLGVKSRIEMICNPILTDKFFSSYQLRQLGRMKWNIAEEKKVVLSVGQIVIRKGIEEFIKIAKMLPELLFLWAGDIPAFASDVGRLKELMISAPTNIRFLGIVPHHELPALYNAADIFLNPSRQEICCLVTLEASACGLPIILHDNLEYRTLFSEYIACQDISDYVKWIKLLLESETDYQSAINKSNQLIKPFSSEAIVKQWLNIYYELANNI